MGDFVEKNPVNSCTYEDYSSGVSLPDSSPLVSIASEPAVDLSSTSSNSSNYSEPLRLPTHLLAHDRIRIADGKGGSRDLEFIDLIREARTDAGARSQLLTLAQAAAADPRITSSCFLASEENLLPILAQLGSSDPTARREGALSLRQFIQSNPEDRRLQQGLLATVDQIARQNPSNTEARELLVSVYRDSSPQNSGLRQWMQNNTAVTSYAPNAVAANGSNSAPRGLATPIVGGGSPNSANSNSVGSSDNQVSSSHSLSLSQVLSLPGFAPLAALIEQRTQGTPLQGIAPEGIVGFALTHANLAPSEFNDLLYLRIMAAALPLSGFTGNQFGSSMIVATNLARDIRANLNGHGSSSEEGLRLTARSLNPSEATPLGATTTSTLPAPAPTASPLLDSSSTVLAANGSSPLHGSFPTTFNFFVPSLLTSLSGMQGLTAQPTALGPSALASQAFGFGNHSSYHVEGPTNLDEDSHQGFGGGSQGQQDQDQDEREESHPQDSYYA